MDEILIQTMTEKSWAEVVWIDGLGIIMHKGSL